MDLHKSLLEYEKQGKNVRVGLVGAGQMGEGLVCQMELMNAMRAVAVADVLPGRAKEAFLSANVESRLIVETEDPAVASQAVEDGKRIATTNPALLSLMETTDIVVEATGVPEVGARIAFDAILNRKHVLQMNVETDATVG